MMSRYAITLRRYNIDNNASDAMLMLTPLRSLFSLTLMPRFRLIRHIACRHVTIASAIGMMLIADA